MASTFTRKKTRSRTKPSKVADMTRDELRKMIEKVIDRKLAVLAVRACQKSHPLSVIASVAKQSPDINKEIASSLRNAPRNDIMVFHLSTDLPWLAVSGTDQPKRITPQMRQRALAAAGRFRSGRTDISTKHDEYLASDYSA